MVVFGGDIAKTKEASALEYQSNNINVKFTFTPVLTMSLSSSDISIADLTPGNQAKSGAFNVVVSTNNVKGYTLKASVGNAENATTDLVKSGDNVNKFEMISAAGALTAGEWGYTIGESGTTYNALPLYTGTATTINQTTNAAGTAATNYTGTSTTDFRIGAYASTSQLAGDYSNVINFTAVTNSVE